MDKIMFSENDKEAIEKLREAGCGEAADELIKLLSLPGSQMAASLAFMNDTKPGDDAGWQKRCAAGRAKHERIIRRRRQER